MTLTYGSLFSGIGGLEMGVQSVLGGETLWHVEFDEAPSKVLRHHWPGIPNYGDIRAVDWTQVPPVDILTGGFPCQDVSLAGRRAGITAGTRSGLWSEFARAIDVLRPGLVVIENVRGLLSATADGAVEPDPWGVGDGATRPVVNALGVVLGDLASLGYDTVRCGLRAADAGAPHGRYRIFVLAYPAGQPWRIGDGNDVPAWRGAVGRGEDAGRGSAEDPNFAARGERRLAASGQAEGGWAWSDPGRRGRAPTADASDYGRKGCAECDVWQEGRLKAPRRSDTDGRVRTNWGEYEPAIRRWEAVIDRGAPAPTLPNGKNASHRLSARFVEWMQGYKPGHVTDVGITRNEQLKALGNCVVPQQAALAVRTLLPLMKRGVS